jgi:hypothetical protein
MDKADAIQLRPEIKSALDDFVKYENEKSIAWKKQCTVGSALRKMIIDTIGEEMCLDITNLDDKIIRCDMRDLSAFNGDNGYIKINVILQKDAIYEDKSRIDNKVFDLMYAKWSEYSLSQVDFITFLRKEDEI